MTRISFAVLAAALAAALPATAQTFEEAVADASAAARQAFSVQGLPTTYAATIVCAHPPKESDLPENLKFYTDLGRNKLKSIPSDDTASRLNDYRSSGVRDGRWRFDAWSCDTQDYSFDFAMSDLVRGSKTETSRAIKGHAHIETRGQTDFDGALDCVAYW